MFVQHVLRDAQHEINLVKFDLDSQDREAYLVKNLGQTGVLLASQIQKQLFHQSVPVQNHVVFLALKTQSKLLVETWRRPFIRYRK